MEHETKQKKMKRYNVEKNGKEQKMKTETEKRKKEKIHNVEKKEKQKREN